MSAISPVTLQADTFVGALTGNASTATKLATARAINGVNFDGSAAITLTSLGTMTADLLFTDATYDIGKSGATRPRDIFASRNCVIGGTLAVTGASTLSGNISFAQASARITPGATNFGITNAAGTANNLLITDAGIVSIGNASTASGASGGDFIGPYGYAIRSVDNAGATAKRLVSFRTLGAFTDVVYIGGDTGDIGIGRSTIALGGGAAPTLGTTGGSGPATAAQNGWLKFIDNTGAAMYVPMWK